MKCNPEKFCQTRKVDSVVVLLIAAVAAVLLLANLGNQYLWQDEAQTALIAKTVLAHGLPLGNDGKNSFSQEQGEDCSPNGVCLWPPSFQFYLAAAFFGLFGSSTFVARLPFALFGVATVLLVYYFALAIFESRRTAAIAALVLLTSVPFLVLCRQCRYYAPYMFFSLLGLYGYHALLAGRRHGPLTLFLGGLCTFYNHYVGCAALLATVFIHALIWRRDKLAKVTIVCVAVAVATAPTLIWLWTSGMRRTVMRPADTLATVELFVPWFAGQVFKHIFPLQAVVATVLVGAACWVKARRLPRPSSKTTQDVGLLILFAVMVVVANAPTAIGTFFRYLAPIIPVAALLVAAVIEAGLRVRPIIGVAAAAVLLVGSPMPSYLYEITHDYDGPVEGICKYLNAHAKPTDIVAVNYEDLPIKFYTGLRVVGGLTGEDLSPVKNAHWVILRRHVICDAELAVHEYIQRTVDPDAYEPTVLNYPDIAFENREDPDKHHFRTVEDADPVVIFERTGP